MIVVDTSALIAILDPEPNAALFKDWTLEESFGRTRSLIIVSTRSPRTWECITRR